jgi:hypothetical protein
MRFLDHLKIISEEQKSNARTAPIPHVARTKAKRPPACFAKIHVDAGVLAGRGGSAAVVCRDNEFNYLGSSVLVIEGVTDPATLEAIACREALALAEDLHL